MPQLSEWLKLMLAEIARKREEDARAREEEVRRQREHAGGTRDAPPPERTQS